MQLQDMLAIEARYFATLRSLDARGTNAKAVIYTGTRLGAAAIGTHLSHSRRVYFADTGSHIVRALQLVDDGKVDIVIAANVARFLTGWDYAMKLELPHQLFAYATTELSAGDEAKLSERIKNSQFCGKLTVF